MVRLGYVRVDVLNLVQMVVAELVREVYSVEIIDSLALQAGERLQGLGYRNVRVRRSDGHAGWPEASPFDAIVVTAAAARVPAAAR